MAKESKDRELTTVAAKLALLNEQLVAYHQLMTASLTPSVSFRYFFQELVTPSDEVIPTVFEGEGKFVSIIDQVASMVFQTLSKQKVEFAFRKERDFVHKGICMLCDVTYL